MNPYMKNFRSRKAFTLIELIVVIVVLGLLSGISIVGYQAVISRSSDAAAEQTIQSYDRGIRALASFDQASPKLGEYHKNLKADQPDGFALAFTGTDTAGDAVTKVDADVLAATDLVVTVTFFEESGATPGFQPAEDKDEVGTLTVSADSDVPGIVSVNAVAAAPLPPREEYMLGLEALAATFTPALELSDAELHRQYDFTPEGVEVAFDGCGKQFAFQPVAPFVQPKFASKNYSGAGGTIYALNGYDTVDAIYFYIETNGAEGYLGPDQGTTPGASDLLVESVVLDPAC